MLAHRLRRRPNIKTILVQCLVFAGYSIALLLYENPVGKEASVECGVWIVVGELPQLTKLMLTWRDTQCNKRALKMPESSTALPMLHMP